MMLYGRSILFALVIVLNLTAGGAAHATCVLQVADLTPLGQFIDNCTYPDIVVMASVTGGPCDRTVVGDEILVATMKTVSVAPVIVGTNPTVCVTAATPGTPALHIWGGASDITFATSVGRFDFIGWSSPAVQIDGTTGHLFVGSGGSGPLPLWIGFGTGDPAAIVMTGGASAEVRTAFVDTSLLGVSVQDTAVASFHQAAFVENDAIALLEDNSQTNFNRYGDEPSAFTLNGDGIVIRDSAALKIDHSIFHHNFTWTPPPGVYRYLLRADGTASVRWGNVAVHHNGDAASRRAIGFSISGNARGKVIAATWADNNFEVVLSLLSAFGTLESFDSFLFKSGVPFQCVTVMNASTNDVWPTTTLPWCVPPQYNFDPGFVTAGLAVGAVVTDDRVYLVDSANVGLVQDAGTVPASIYFGTGDWTVFDWASPPNPPSPNREEWCSIDDLGYHNHCPNCAPSSCP